MSLKKDLAITAFILLFAAGVVAHLSTISRATSTVDAKGSFSHHVGIGNGMAWGTGTLVASTTEVIDTGLLVVHACNATIGAVSSSTPTANLLTCIPADQSAVASRGRIWVRAGRAGIGASAGIFFDVEGNTDVMWSAYSYQAR